MRFEARHERWGGIPAERLPPPTVDAAMRAAFAAALFAAGGAMGLLTLLLPHPPGMDTTGIAAASVGAVLSAGGILALRRRISPLGLELIVALGTMLISLAVYFSGAATTTYAFFYLWVMLYAAYFFGHLRAALQLVIVGLCYAIVLILKPEVEGGLQSWFVAVGTLLMAGALFAFTRDRVAALLERLGEAAATDPLTSLLNRRGFGDQFELEIERARRSKEPFGVLVGDLDHFKTVNDRFGHPAGDAVLQAVGVVLRDGARRIDTVARIGGEEFALLLPSTGSQGAFMLAEKLRAAVREAPEARGLTISFGVTSYPADGATVEDLLRCADEALYAAKTLGRDRAVVYSEEVVGALAGDSGAEGPVSSLATLLTLAEALDVRDARTVKHSASVGRYAEVMARELGLPPARVERVRLAGVLHDIGKIGVPDSVLHKVDELGEADWQEIRRHPEVGARLLSAPGLEDLRAWVLAHHERLDGTGYPFGLRGREISLEARILAVADAYEAMLADHPYRKGMPVEQALGELRHHAGSQFDADVVDALVRARPDLRTERAASPAP